ncbi:hypothetical protein [Hydrogenophaga sp.]|uniref:hypothetical protein n=1 Tax=Hydrogenophaga sp. TaxID=1904254 RepID=UPI00272129E3|nr:hypothetical protein [Hydrogenophaga sp.]MDO9132259.1 hypothetical protein [Hydrogenophaga sp.]
MNDTTNTTKKSTYELVTQQVREHLIPLNAVLALCITLWAVIDFASPLLGVPGLLLVAGVMGLAAALCFWRLPAEPVVQRLKALGFGLLLSALGLGSAGATLRAKEGGWIASSFGKVRDCTDRTVRSADPGCTRTARRRSSEHDTGPHRPTHRGHDRRKCLLSGLSLPARKQRANSTLRRR